MSDSREPWFRVSAAQGGYVAGIVSACSAIVVVRVWRRRHDNPRWGLDIALPWAIGMGAAQMRNFFDTPCVNRLDVPWW